MLNTYLVPIDLLGKLCLEKACTFTDRCRKFMQFLICFLRKYKKEKKSVQGCKL